MIEMRKRYSNAWRLIVIALVLMCQLPVLTSCDDDESKSTVIDYYLNVEEAFLVNGSNETISRYENPVTRMRNAIKQAYPTPDTQGNDEAVIAACDQEYRAYVDMYSMLTSDHFTCLFHLVRATKVGGIIKQNQTIKTYTYDINPTDD